MHHYAHHIGDYRAHTAHLTMVEDGAYRRLLDLYYLHEKPLPANVAMCQRLTACRTKEERAAVQAILQEFFTLEADGWHQRKADAVILEYQEKAETARKNGRGGGRPKTKTKPRENQSGFSSVPENNPEETITINHKPLTNSEANASGGQVPPRDVIFSECLPWLMRKSGKTRDACARMIGHWLKETGDNDQSVLDAMLAAEQANPVDPFPWIAGRLKPREARETWDQRRIREAMEAIQ